MPIPDQAGQVSRPLARDQVYERLRGWIIAGVLRPGELIRDQALAESLGVSRTPVREALRRLEDEQLVETSSNRWTRVAPLDVEQADQLYGVVQVLEDYALGLATSALTNDDLQALEAANAELAIAIAEHDPARALEADNTFHDVWIRRSGNAELARILCDTKARLRRLELAHFDSADATASVLEHASVIASLREHKRSGARKALEVNWEGATSRFSKRASSRKEQP